MTQKITSFAGRGKQKVEQTGINGLFYVSF